MNEPFLLSNLIDLQEIDNKIYKLETDKKSSESVQRLMALESEFNSLTKKIHEQKNSMESYYSDVEEILRTHKSIIQKFPA
jgi:predicted  nucleic acid-binding Zn-ribbon protein